MPPSPDPRRPTSGRLLLAGAGVAGVLALLVSSRRGPAREAGPAHHPGGASAASPAGVADRSRLDGERDLRVGRARDCTSVRCRVNRDLVRIRRGPDGRRALPGEAVVRFDSPEAMQEFVRRARLHGLAILGVNAGLSSVRVGYDRRGRLRDVLLEQSGGYQGIDGNFVVALPAEPEPERAAPERGQDGHGSFDGTGFLEAIGADGDRSGWGKGVTVAVVDSGVGPHPTLLANQVTHVDLVGADQPLHGHGTAMAGLIGGSSPDAPGIAPGVHILDVRVLGSDGSGTSFDVAEGITLAADRGADVINLSLGSGADARSIREAVDYARGRGSVLVAAAGNEGRNDGISYPAGIEAVIAVGGIDASRSVAWFSNWGPNLDVMAPAVDIRSAAGDGAVIVGSGTSQATALTSGVVAYGLGAHLTGARDAEQWLGRNALALGPGAAAGSVGMLHVPARGRTR